jgi:hypothetical protein
MRKLITVSNRLIAYTSTLFSILFICNESRAQQSDSLAVVTLSLQYPQVQYQDTAYEGVAYNAIKVTVKNLSIVNTFAGQLGVYLHSDSLLVTDTLVSFSGTTYTILPQDTLPITLSGPYYFNHTVYRAGSNIVVVWPVANGLVKSDSLFTGVYFVPLAGITIPHETENNFSVTPNPCNDFLRLVDFMKSEVEGVRITDMKGRVVKQTQHPFGNCFYVGNLDKGCYTVELIRKNKTKSVSRFIKL